MLHHRRTGVTIAPAAPLIHKIASPTRSDSVREATNQQIPSSHTAIATDARARTQGLYRRKSSGGASTQPDLGPLRHGSHSSPTAVGVQAPLERLISRPHFPHWLVVTCTLCPKHDLCRPGAARRS